MADFASVPDVGAPGKVRTPRRKDAPKPKPGVTPLPSIAPVLGDRARRDENPTPGPLSPAGSEKTLVTQDSAKRSKQEELGDRLLAELIRSLHSLKDEELIDVSSIQKMESFKSQTAQDVARLLRSLQHQMLERHRAPTQTDDEGQDADSDQNLAAQVGFLDKKIHKLREKLRKRAKEASELSQEPAVDAPAGSRASLVTEVGSLRAQVSELTAEVKAGREQQGKRQRGNSPERPDQTIGEAQGALEAMRQRVVDAQTKMAALIREKEDAEASAQLAQKLVKNVESRLRDAVISRESEQADLIGEQKTLHQRLEVQNRRIAELERQQNHVKKFESLQNTLQEYERELAKEQEDAKKAEATAAELEEVAAKRHAASLGTPDAMTFAMSLLEPEQGAVSSNSRAEKYSPSSPEVQTTLSAVYAAISDHTEPSAPTDSKTTVEIEIDPEKEYEESLEFQQKCDKALQEKQEAQVALAAKNAMLASLTEHMQKQIQDMEKMLKDIEENRNSGLQELIKKHEDEVSRREAKYQDSHHQIMAKANQDKAEKTGRLQSTFNETVNSEKKVFEEFQNDAEMKSKQLELRAAHLSNEVLRAKHDTELVRLQREFRGAFYLTVRRATYRRSELVCCISEALKLPSKRIRIIDEDAPLDIAAPTKAPPAEAPKAPTLNLESGEKQVEPHAPVLKRTNPFHRTLKGRRRGDHAETDDTDVNCTQTAIFPSQDESKNAAMTEVVAGARPASASGVKPSIGARQQEHQRIFIEIIEDPAVDKSMGTSRCGLVTRLAGLISQGDPRLHELAVTQIEVACGETRLPSQWPSQMARPIDRRGRNLAGRSLVVTAYQLVDPFIVKFVAFDEEDGREFVLHLYENDVRSLVGTALLDPSRLRDMVEALVGTLRVIHKDRQILLVAIQQIQPPPSVNNEIDPLLSATERMSTQHRKWQRKLANRRDSKDSLTSVPEVSTSLALLGDQTLSHSQGNLGNTMLALSHIGGDWDALALPSATLTGQLMTQSAFQTARPEPEDWQLAFEDILMLEGGHMALFWIQKEMQSGNIQLMLQETGKCKPFNITMSGAGAQKQQRIYAQLCDFGELELMLMVEEVAVPPVLVVRIVQGNSAFPATWQESEEHVFCFSRQDLRLISEGSSELAYPSQRRAQLLQFLHQVPTSAKTILEGTNSALTGAGGTAYKYGSVGKEKDGKIVFDPNITQIASQLTTEKARNETISKSNQHLIAKCGRRLEYIGESKLFVLRVFRRTEPYSYYVVSAFELGTCREWELLIDDSDLFKCLKTRTTYTDKASQRQACMELMHRCAFSTVGGTQALTLKKVTGDLVDIRKIADNANAKVPEVGTLGISKLFGTANGTLSLTKAFESIGAADIERACREMAGAAGAKPSGTVLSGGHFVDLRRQGRKSADEYYRAKVHSCIRRFGSLDIVFTIEVTPGSGSHILSAYHPLTMTLYELSAATRDDTQPQKICMENVAFAGLNLVFSITETAFPHSVHFLVMDPASGNEFRCSVKDETIFAMIPRSQRELFSTFTEQLLKYGTVGEGGSGAEGFQDVELGGSSIDLAANVIPVIRLPFAPVSSAEEKDTIPIYSTSRSMFIEGSEEPKEIRISLSKSTASQDFFLGVEDFNTESGSMHIINLCDKCCTSPFALYGELHRVSGLNLFILALIDSAPRAVRIVVAEPTTGWKFQAVVLDSPVSGQVLPYLDVSQCRTSLTDVFMTNFSTKPSVPMSKAIMPPSRPNSRPTTPGEVKISKLVHRTTHKLHSGQPVILSVIRELVSDNSTRFRVIMYNPMTAKENSLLLMNPLLDQVLALAGFGDSRTVTVEEIDRRKEEIASQILACTYVHPDGTEIEFRTSTQAQKYNAQCRRTSASSSTTMMLRTSPAAASKEATSLQGSGLVEANGTSGTGVSEQMALANTLESAVAGPSAEPNPGLLEKVERDTKYGPSPKIRVEVFTHYNARDNISYGTNFQVAVTSLKTEETSSFIVHETTLDTWMQENDVKYLLNASREEDLVYAIAQHAYLNDAGELAFEPIDVSSNKRYAPPQLVRSKTRVA